MAAQVKQAPLDTARQTIQVAGSARPGETAIYRHPYSKPDLSVDDGSGVQTLYENFQYGVKSYPDSTLIGYRPFNIQTGKHENYYTWQTFREVNERVTNLGSGLLQLQSTLSSDSVRRGGWNLGLYSGNRPSWFVAEQACNAYSLVSVALYDTLGPKAAEYIVNHAEIPIIVAAGDKLPLLLASAEAMPSLKIIISMDPLDAPLSSLPPGYADTRSLLNAWSKRAGIQILEFSEVEALGQKNPHVHIPPSPKDICTLCYTSGTTGNPKGVMSTHENYISSSMSAGFTFDVKPSDVHISYLPLAHCMERCSQAMMLRMGASIGFHSGDIADLMEDIAILRPTIFPSVPRLFNRIYDRLTAATIHAPGLKGALFRKAYAAKRESMLSGAGPEHAVYDRLLFSKVRAVLGGRVRSMLTGSAPIGPDVLEFMRVAFSCPVYEGYGQTENAAACTVTMAEDYNTGRVGAPFRCNEVKLVDVPDMQYHATDKPCPRGEIMVRGTNVFVGYYKEPEKTAEALGEDGWLRTGDIGRINTDGSISIIDRKKNIFKLAQGEYVAPEKIENVYKLSPLVENIYVHGDSLESSLVGVISPDPEEFIPWVHRFLGTSSISMADSLQDSRVRQAVLKELNKSARAGKLRGFEFIKAVHLVADAFSVDNGTMTPTLKIKRNECAKLYRANIDEMYAVLKNPSPKL
ncbi:hypothetical protein BJ684DRAFT_20818 [Piptocephalis cylindrospora]|uniref:Long-chain-fatty-acid--CoA ligase n=1 Tax=Piptocephalis cylindrospora TaxID=1907219 RepID=A0A4P9Y1N2_9FUNG|nr:hypothetical protein BJ684DRAFT_20818 [Piptocephalis cylindrospora]|eukprot:RKP12653.1 hypothetical protein BJ684DRAFT_20818 [Piptocephalis cylindrospora]